MDGCKQADVDEHRSRMSGHGRVGTDGFRSRIGGHRRVGAGQWRIADKNKLEQGHV